MLKDAGVQIAPSTYYVAKTRPPSARSLSDAATTTLIEQVHADNFGVYGARGRCTPSSADRGIRSPAAPWPG